MSYICAHCDADFSDNVACPECVRGWQATMDAAETAKFNLAGAALFDRERADKAEKRVKELTAELAGSNAIAAAAARERDAFRLAAQDAHEDRLAAEVALRAAREQLDVLSRM